MSISLLSGVWSFWLAAAVIVCAVIWGFYVRREICAGGSCKKDFNKAANKPDSLSENFLSSLEQGLSRDQIIAAAVCYMAVADESAD